VNVTRLAAPAFPAIDVSSTSATTNGTISSTKPSQRHHLETESKRNQWSRPHRSTDGAEGCEEALHRFVRERRLRLAPESLFLGERRRLPNRIGKPVTQEELAEHLGITRGWYARFEAGAATAFSIALLNRLGDVLLLSAPERAELIRLAMPKLSPVIARDSTDLYEALGAMRRAVKRLWSASSEGEILHIAGEEARRLVRCFELIFARRIVTVREVQLPQPGGNSAAARLARARNSAICRFTPEQLARLDAFWQCAPPGALLSIDAYPPDILRVIRLALREHGIDWNLKLAAPIHGSRGSAYVGGQSTRPHDVSELDRTLLSSIADFASLALR
jgi:transcriptional regulator with XRE-family HTH domain